jgi:hypothetical protein
MNASPRVTLVAALAACLSASVLACHRDEPATYVPKSGTWMYAEQFVDSNTCAADTLPDPVSMFSLDHDGGDSFQVELGENDVTCEIDGTDFYCTDWIFDNDVPDLDATLRYSVTWEGEFLSETEAEGREISSLTCVGEACPAVEMVLDVPCTRIVSFEATAE